MSQASQTARTSAAAATRWSQGLTATPRTTPRIAPAALAPSAPSSRAVIRRGDTGAKTTPAGSKGEAGAAVAGGGAAGAPWAAGAGAPVGMGAVTKVSFA